MRGSGAVAFLQQAHRNNWQRYLTSLQPRAPRGWDLCILTAHDARQAAMYRRQLEWRRAAGLLPVGTRFVVLPDPAGQNPRLGSGGATLRALAAMMWGASQAATDADDAIGLPADGRGLIIHSGGDSRRLPHCSVVGKLFARVPRELPDGRASTLFDEFLISLSGLASSLPPGVLIASGDVLLVFDHLQLTFRRPGVIGVAAAAPIGFAAQHGVYATAADGLTVAAYLHRPTAAELARWSAVRSDRTVQVDTGLVWVDRPTAGKLAGLAGQLPEPACGLSLYGDLLLPLASSTTQADYLAAANDEPVTCALQAARRIIWEQWRGTPFTVEQLQPAAFIPLRTSEEYWQRMAGDSELAALCGWNLDARAAGQPICINAVVAEARAADGTAPPVLIVDSCLEGPFVGRGAGIVANVETAAALTLDADLVLHQLPVADGYVTRLYGLRDDPKLSLTDPAATFLNRPWSEWLARDDALAAALWPDSEPSARTLWNARLYPLCADRAQSLACALALPGLPAAGEAERAAWQAATRLSLADSFHRADGERILAEAAAVEDQVAARRFYAAVCAEAPAQQAKTRLGMLPEAVKRRATLVGQRLATDAPILRLRGYAALAVATDDPGWEDRAFATLAEMIAAAVRLPEDRPAALARCAARPVRVQAAARIDFGGGWTDTPPYSIERGGTVLNAAITLNGRHPIVAEAIALAEPRLILDSRDIGAVLAPETVGAILDYANPADPFALLKAALVLRGVVAATDDPARPLREVFARGGAGLHLSTQTFIPRGSGLGTSSIMAGAVLTALARWQGETLSADRLFDEVLCLEQMLTTGGGWQDQVGGLTGGIKLVTTQPGLPQVIRVEPVALSPRTAADLATRLLLVYTGQQRLAKNLLRNVMIRWMTRDPEMVWIQAEIARLAVAMRDALQAGDLDTFGALLSEHWALNKRMDPGCTNPFIDDLFDVLAPYINGGKLAGAGGGGYAIVVARSAEAARALAETLAARYPHTPVGLWPCGVPEEGLIGSDS